MPTTKMESETGPFTHPDGWSLSRSICKASCWAIDGFLVFSIFLIALEAIHNCDRNGYKCVKNLPFQAASMDFGDTPWYFLNTRLK